ncbi:pentatricopeptide repeat-containing protein [Tanacetum coccineum]
MVNFLTACQWCRGVLVSASKHYRLHYIIRSSNDGKSTLLDQLTRANILAEDRLFTTHDLCKKGKLKEAIELLDHGEVANAKHFGLLFGLCGKLKKLEESKKVHDYFLRSSFRVNVGLVHKGKNKVNEFRNPTLYKDGEKIRVANGQTLSQCIQPLVY